MYEEYSGERLISSRRPQNPLTVITCCSMNSLAVQPYNPQEPLDLVRATRMVSETSRRSGLIGFTAMGFMQKGGAGASSM